MAFPVEIKSDSGVGAVWLTAVLALVERRSRLCRRAPACPRCGETFQVQLLFDAFSAAARWRCRMCHFPFVYEPLIPVNGDQRSRCDNQVVVEEIYGDG